MMLMVNLQYQDSPERYPVLQIRSPRIVIVDNDKIHAKQLSNVFDKLGFNHRVYHQLGNIIPLVDEFAPDLVLMEYLLPWLKGGELCSQLRSKPHTCHLPVIMYSSFSKAHLFSYKCGGDAFLQKPFSIKILLSTMNSFLKERKLLRKSHPISPSFDQN
ncbi:response regulator [Pedobacter gandavensis]|uniref:Response regulator n=1 Tax=Pedobacter gandavensis TaxID=2679963 RepID=A0ABR6EYP5_9SPHI|nr:response regulator [Pedobacter gandavensis]MBB2150355.1 response regulator [Pedobacter gandavensis]